MRRQLERDNATKRLPCEKTGTVASKPTKSSVWHCARLQVMAYAGSTGNCVRTTGVLVRCIHIAMRGACALVMLLTFNVNTAELAE